MTKVLEAAFGPSSNAEALFTLGSESSLYIEIKVAFRQEALDSGFHISWFLALDGLFNPDEALYLNAPGDERINTWNATNGPFATPLVADTYYVIRLHVQSANPEIVTLFLDGVDIGPVTNPGFLLGPYTTLHVGAGPTDGSAVSGAKIYYEYVKVSATAFGNTDVFQSDFESGVIVPPYSSTSTSGSGALAIIDDPFGPTPPPPSIRFFKDFPWRFVVADLNCATITFLDRLANGKNVTYVINQPAASSGVVPADNPEVNIVHTDGDPFLHHNNRILFGFRREGGTPPWVIRFAGIIMLDDDTAADAPTTRYTAWDPWELLNHRPLLNSDGELPGQNGLSFKNTRGDLIALHLLEWTVGTTGEVFIDYGQTGFYTPSFDATPVIWIPFQQGISVGEAWTQLCDSGTIDIYLKPIYDPINRPGFTHELYLFEQMGSIRRDAIFAWDKPSRSLVGVSRQDDGSQMANVAQYYAGQGGAPVPIEVNVASIAKYGEWWAQQFFPGTNMAAAVQLLALAQVRLRANGKRTLTFDPAPERSPILFSDYFLGDEVSVYTSQRLRAAQATLERVHGIPIEIDDNGVETVRALLTADESVTDT